MSTTTPNTVKSASPHKPQILIVEDDQFMLKAHEIKFTHEGFDIWFAKDGDEALAFLSRERPDVVLLDLMLPRTSGFDVLATIRKNNTWKDVPVIVMTNLGQPQDIERAKLLGASDYLIKANTKISDVVKKVREYL
jgi:DNA-binding response OmpR family regulator